MFHKIPYGIRALLPRALKTRAYHIGKFLYGHEDYPSVETILGYLASWGFQSPTAIDVGAYRGDWTTMLKTIFPRARVLMIEGQCARTPDLERVCRQFPGEVVAETVLLGPVDGQKVKFVEMETGSSVLEESSPYPRTYVEKSLETLDSVVGRHPEFMSPSLLKLDVQGYELEVLKGAPGVLGKADLVLVEVSLIPINRGCPLFSDVVRFMTERHYWVIDFCSQVRRKDGALWQTDLLFAREGTRWIRRPELDLANWA